MYIKLKAKWQYGYRYEQWLAKERVHTNSHLQESFINTKLGVAAALLLWNQDDCL